MHRLADDLKSAWDALAGHQRRACIADPTLWPSLCVADWEREEIHALNHAILFREYDDEAEKQGLLTRLNTLDPLHAVAVRRFDDNGDRLAPREGSYAAQLVERAAANMPEANAC